MAITLAEAKLHLGIGHDLQDALITKQLNAAVDACGRFIGSEGQPDPLPPIFDQAVLMTLGAMFDRREGATVPEEAQSLLASLRGWTF